MGGVYLVEYLILKFKCTVKLTFDQIFHFIRWESFVPKCHVVLFFSGHIKRLLHTYHRFILLKWLLFKMTVVQNGWGSKWGVEFLYGIGYTRSNWVVHFEERPFLNNRHLEQQSSWLTIILENGYFGTISRTQFRHRSSQNLW